MRSRFLHPLVLLVSLLVTVSACQAVAQLPAQFGVDGAPLVVLETSGGRCVDGECTSRATLDASGRLGMFDGTETALPAARVARIAELIRATDWASVTAKPFTGECQTAVDGQELTWTIQTPGGPVVIADCSVAVDYQAPPFPQLLDEFFATGGNVPGG